MRSAVFLMHPDPKGPRTVAAAGRITAMGGPKRRREFAAPIAEDAPPQRTFQMAKVPRMQRLTMSSGHQLGLYLTKIRVLNAFLSLREVAFNPLTQK
jgi:hypothetical protein